MPTVLESARAAVDGGKVQVLVSDLDGVLRHFSSGLWDELDAMTGVAGGESFRAILGNPVLDDVTRGRMTHAQWREDATHRLRDAGAEDETAGRAVETWAGTPATVDPDVADLLRDAQRHGVPVFVFTNGSDRVPEEIAALSLDEFTGPDGSHLINSADLGATKPHERAYAAAHRLIEERLGRDVDPADVLFLDDSATHVQGARAFGWSADRYRGNRG